MRYLLTIWFLCGAGLANAQALQKTVGIDDTNVSVTIRIVDSTDGTPETGVTSATGGLDLEYRREGAASVDLTESNLSALTDAHSDGGMLHIGNGYYRIDVPDAAFATGADSVLIHGTATDMVVIGSTVQITATLTVDGDGYASANVVEVNGTTQTAGDLASLITTADTAIDGVKTKTDYLPSATAGASGGLLIAGTNAATTFTSASGAALTISSTGGNGHGLSISGNGTGEGISVTGGATGNAFELIGGATSGQGLRITTTSGDGIYVAAQGGTSDAMNLIGATLGNGVTIEGDIGLDISGSGAGGIQLSGATYGLDINDGMDVASGLSIAGGATIANSAGTALTLTSSGSNGSGLIATGNGTGHGISAVAGGSVGSVGLRASNTNGYGLEAYSSDNDGAIFNTGGENTDGLVLTGDAGGADLRLTNATGSDLGTAIDTIDTTADAILVDTGTTLPATLATLDSGFVRNTTVASVTSQTQLVLTAGPDFDDALNNQVVVLTDATNNDYESMRVITDYVGSTKTATINAAADFTVAAGDGFKVYPTSPYVDSSIASVTSSTAYTKDNVDSSRVWTFPKNWKSSESPVTIVENASFNGAVKFDLTNRVNSGAGALTVSSVTCDPDDGLTIGTPVKTSDNMGVLVNVSGFESGVTYTFTVTHSTTDSDTALVSTGKFKAE